MRLVRRSLSVLVSFAAACGEDDDLPLPPPVISEIAPSAICSGRSLPMADTEIALQIISGENFVDGATVYFPGHPPESDDLDSNVHSWVLTESIIAVRILEGLGAPADGEPPNVYDLVVENPDGQEARMTDALTDYSTLTLASVSPPRAASGNTVTLTLAGRSFFGPMTVELGATALAFNRVAPTSDTSATVPLDLRDVPPGTYPVIVRNAGGCQWALESAFTVD